MTPGMKKLSIAIAVAAVTGLALTGRAEATPQFAVVGQSLGLGTAQAEPVTYYYNRYRRSYGGYGPYRRYSYSYRYARPYYGRYSRGYNYRRYGYGYNRYGYRNRQPFFYFGFGR